VSSMMIPVSRIGNIGPVSLGIPFPALVVHPKGGSSSVRDRARKLATGPPSCTQSSVPAAVCIDVVLFIDDQLVSTTNSKANPGAVQNALGKRRVPRLLSRVRVAERE